MKKSDDLFRLIKAMSKSEKRYFKLHAAMHTIGGQNVYVKLFDAIDDMKEYDEDALEEKFKDEKFSKHLFSVKNYLVNLILKVLTAYYHDSSVELKLKTMLTELDILFDKGLYKQYKTMLAKAEKLAKDNEKNYFLALILEKKAIFILTQYYGEKVQNNMDSLRDEMIDVLNKIRYTFEYKVLYDKFFFLTKHDDFAISRGEEETLKKFISDPLLADDTKAVTIQAKIFYYSIMSFYYYRIGDYNNCYRVRKTLVALIEKKPENLDLYARGYISALANLALVCEAVGKYDETNALVKKIRTILNSKYKNEKNYRDVWSKIMIPLVNSELMYYIKTCRFDKFDSVINKIIPEVEKYTEKFNEAKKIIIYNSVAYAYFINKKYSKALEYINKILNFQSSSPEEKMYSVTRIFSLIIYFELGDYELLEYGLRSTKRYLLKKHHLYSLEMLIMDFMEDMLDMEPGVKSIERFKKLKNDVKKLPEVSQRLPMEFFDIISWIESKINSKDLREILTDKNMAQKVSA